MARPQNKASLLEAGDLNYQKLMDLIESLGEHGQHATFNFEDRDRNIRDVLIHLYEWHQLLIRWIEANMREELRPFLPEPYNWKSYPEMNIKFWEMHQLTPYPQAVVMLKDSHHEVRSLIEQRTDEELFTKKYFKWTGTTSLGSYCVSATSSHYDWALKKIRKHKKSL